MNDPEPLDPWTRIDVSGWKVNLVEPAGSTAGMWLIRPGTTQHWLCKLTTTPATGVEQGEDWAEVVSTQVARALSVPCAQTCLCTQDGQRGSLSLSVRPFGYDLVEGKVLLQTENVPGYVPYEVGGHAADPQRPGVERPGHTLENIRRVLDQVEPPDGWMGPSTATGFDVFVGYLVLDALVANRDRHEENWAVLRAQTNGVADRVSPSYDHGGTLGYQLSEAARLSCLDTQDGVARWAKRGTAWRFEHRRPAPTLVEVAVRGLEMCRPATAVWWRSRLHDLDLSAVVERVSSGVPGMSELAGRFITELLNMNVRRLRDALHISA